jgi:hypothetical protein
MFALGFVLSTLLWLGAWFFYGKPAQASFLEEQETALSKCVEEKELQIELGQRLQTEKEDASRRLEEAKRKLQQARLGWGRCLRNNNAADQQTQGYAEANSPSAD